MGQMARSTVLVSSSMRGQSDPPWMFVDPALMILIEVDGNPLYSR
jgi:hypothetical protein